MNKKRLIIFAILMLIVPLLSGCRLAVENDETTHKADVLCGVFVTLEPIEPVPTDTVIELPADWNGDLNDVLFNEEASRIYATRHEDANGFVDYTFDGIDGYRMFSTTEKNAAGEVTVNASSNDSQWQDRSSDYSITDNGEEIKLAGTLCFDVHSSCRVYTNPVYQTADGRVYITYGDGHFYDVPDKQPGEWGSTTISATVTQTENGKETSRSIEALVKLAGANTNKQIVLKQMDSENKVIEQTVVTQGDIPESVRIMSNAAYMILEEHSIDFEDKATVSRTLLTADAETFDARFTGENGIVEAHPVALVH